MNAISDLLGCRHPVIQGAMGVISNPELVAAVSEAGGYGLLATAFITDPDFLKQQIEAVQRLTGKPFGANLAAFNPSSPVLAEVIADMGIGAVTTSAGFPGPLVDYLKGRRVKVLHVVPNVKSALKAAAAGVDAVIAEGMESGGAQGHQGVSTMVLVPMVADAVDIPVVAAGGIADARGFRAALALGAQGVQVGTRFIASRECIAHINYKQAICRAADTDTVLLGGDRIRVRVLRTPVVEVWLQKPQAEIFEFLSAHQKEASLDGDLEAGAVGAGQISGIVKEIKLIREIIKEMVS